MSRSDALFEKTKEWADREAQRCRNLHYKYARRLGVLSSCDLPDAISHIERNGSCYYYAVTITNGVRKRSYLGKQDNPIVMQVKEKRFLEKALVELDKRLSELEAHGNTLKRFSDEEVNDALPKAYRLSDEMLKEIAGKDEEEKWYLEAIKAKERDEQRQTEFFKSGRIHTAKDGTCVRSKSELSIANALVDRGIKYVYEMPFRVNGLPLHPDFMFYSYSRGKAMIWEHAGMMGNEGYRIGFADRVDQYIVGGYVPCVDVIFTFDKTDGSIDSSMIDAIIDEYM